MAKCQFFKIYKKISPPEVYGHYLGKNLDHFECKLNSTHETGVCLLHLPDPSKNPDAVAQTFSKGIADKTIPLSTEPRFYFFPLGFTLGRLSGIDNNEIHFTHCIFFSNPFEDFQHSSSYRMVGFQFAIFACESELIMPPANPVELLLTNCKFMPVKINGKRYPQNITPSLTISKGNPESMVHLNGSEIKGSLHSRNLNCKVDFGYSNPKVSGSGRQLEVNDLFLSGEVSVPVEIRFVKVNNRFALETCHFLKHVVFEGIQNKSFIANRCFFREPDQSLIDGINFKEGLFINTNIFDIPIKQAEWNQKIKDDVPFLYDEMLKINKKVTVKNIQSNIYTSYYEKDWKELEWMYRCLKINYQKQVFPSYASNFYYNEMYCRWKQKGLIKKILHWESIYGHFSCWGNSVYRAILVLLFFMTVPIYFYNSDNFFQLSWYLKGEQIILNERLGYSILFSFRNSFLLKPDFLIPNSLFGEVLKTIQSILSAIQIFLVGFTMRRRIKF